MRPVPQTGLGVELVVVEVWGVVLVLGLLMLGPVGVAIFLILWEHWTPVSPKGLYEVRPMLTSCVRTVRRTVLRQQQLGSIQRRAVRAYRARSTRRPVLQRPVLSYSARGWILPTHP